MFDIVGDRIVLSADAMAIPPFKAHYESCADKNRALKEVEYVVWCNKWNTPYLSYPMAVRHKMVGKDVFGIEDYQPSSDIEELSKRFLEFQITSLIRLYTSAEEGLDFLTSTIEGIKSDPELQTMDLESRLKVAQAVGKLIREVEPMAKSLSSAKQRAMAEQVEAGKVRGGGTLGLYEMPRK